ncbi:DUF4282 domain-containing protein [Microbacterium flavum]|uniref:DUF4282 domain-containing protein n=1 Tax=Microbacterium flavum TaxID=415216 RepID=UPI0024AD9346|nr:DUF4282 domain-containing protein [Microbacterium flavum]
MSDQNPPPIPPQPGSGSGPAGPPTPPPGPPPTPGQNEWENVASGAAQSFGNTISGVSTPGFFAGLFDYSFSKFITTKVLGVLYGLVTVLIVIGYIIAVISSFAASVWLGLVVLILGPLIALVYLIFARITLEFYAAAIRTASNTTTLVDQGGLRR